MVEIIPYTEDDEDSSTWIPLSAPNVESTTRPSNAGNFVENNDETDYSEWQELSSNSSHNPNATQITRSSNAESTPWSLWENRIISHLTSTPNASATQEDGYSSENDKEIVWKHADELNENDKLLFKKKGDGSKPIGSSDGKSKPKALVAQRSHNVSSSINQSRRQPVGSEAQPQSSSTPQRNAHPQNSSSEQFSYRQEAKTKLQQSLIYHPMRALPFCILRNLYAEGKHEIFTAWNAYSESHDGPTIYAPLTFFIVVALLGTLLTGTGILKIGSIALDASIRAMVLFMKFVLWGAWGMTTRLAWLSVVFSLIIGVVFWIWLVKTRKSPNTNGVNTDESYPQWAPAISTMLPMAVALSSPSGYEVVAILYSLQALSLPMSNDTSQEFESAEECDAYSSIPTSSSFLTGLVIAVLVIALTFCGVTSFAVYLDREYKQNEGSRLKESAESEASSIGHLDEFVERINRHLSACHTLSVVILTLSAACFLCTRALYLYFGGDLLIVLSGLGTIGFHLLCIGAGVFLVVWAGKSAINELPASNDENDNRNMYQRIMRNALKESIIDITANAVWSNVSGLSGVLSEEDGILRLAILEWLIDRWTSSAGTSPQTSSTPEQSSSTTSTADQCTGDRGISNATDTNNDLHPSTAHQPNSKAHSEVGGTDILNALPSYESLEKVISKLDADETLIPAIQSYQTWISSLPPSRNVAMVVACFKMCPGMISLSILAVWSTLLRLKDAITSQLVSNQCALSTATPIKIWITVFVMSPMLYLEFLRVRRWWTRVACQIDVENKNHTDNMALSIMLEYDVDEPSTSMASSIISQSALSRLILQTWGLLLESIVLLESSIPVVRCATVACVAANLTSDAACLVDLATEIKNRGLLAGIGMLVVDAFGHHLQEELRRRHEENEGDTSTNNYRYPSSEADLGGKYTSSIIKSVGHASKLVHNLNRLRDGSKKPNDDEDHSLRTDPSAENKDSTPIGHTEANSPADLATNHQDDNDESQFLCDAPVNDSVANDNLSQGGGIHDGVTADEASTDKATKKDAEIKKISPEHQVLEATDATQITPTSHEHADAKTLRAANDEKHQDGGGIPVWLGGGLAVVGAVVGGLAVAAATSNGKKDEDKKEQTHKGK